jgi:hypothetical protein
MVTIFWNENDLVAQVRWHFTNFKNAFKGFEKGKCRELSYVLKEFSGYSVTFGGLPPWQ